MRPQFSIPARALCFALSCCILWWSGCSTQVAVEPRSEDAPRGRVESITVVDLQGREFSFAEGYIDGNMFRGRDHRGERQAIPLDEISYFKIYKVDAGKTVASIFGMHMKNARAKLVDGAHRIDQLAKEMTRVPFQSDIFA